LTSGSLHATSARHVVAVGVWLWLLAVSSLDARPALVVASLAMSVLGLRQTRLLSPGGMPSKFPYRFDFQRASSRLLQSNKGNEDLQ